MERPSFANCPNIMGSIKYNGNELSSVADNVRSGIISYLGHDTELLMTLLRITCFLVMIAMYQNTSRTYVSIKKLHRWKMELTHLLVMVV